MLLTNASRLGLEFITEKAQNSVLYTIRDRHNGSYKQAHAWMQTEHFVNWLADNYGRALTWIMD